MIWIIYIFHTSNTDIIKPRILLYCVAFHYGLPIIQIFKTKAAQHRDSIWQCYSALVCHSILYGNVTVLLYVIQFYMAMLHCSCLSFNSIWQCYSALVCHSILYGNVTVLQTVTQFYMAMLQCSSLSFNSIWQCYCVLVCHSILYGNVTVILYVIQFYTAMLQCSCLSFNSRWGDPKITRIFFWREEGH
jgi:hypothetical protein